MVDAHALPRRALLVATSYNGPFFSDGKRTGLYWAEAIHPYNVLVKEGFEVDVTSETGTAGWDENSIAGDGLRIDEESVRDWESKDHPLTHKVEKQLIAAKDVKPEQYGLVFVAGGHGCIVDFPKAKQLHGVVSEVYQRGGVVAAVCHGPALLPGVVDTSGKSVIAGRKVTGFTKEGEKQLGVYDYMQKEGLKTIEQDVTAVGAHYISPPAPMAEFTQTDGRIVTGVNPPSARAKRLCKSSMQ